MTDETSLPELAIKKATNLVRDANMSVVVGLIPILGLIFILRLVQYYLLKTQHPGLVTGETDLSKELRSALPRLWFAVLFWPILIVAIILYFVVVNPRA